MLIVGASGFIGRWLTKELLDHGADVTVAVRNSGSVRTLSAWLVEHGTMRAFASIEIDLTASGPGADAHLEVDDIYNVAGSYRFGMTPGQARAANVDAPRRLVEYAAGYPDLRRLVHVSGYRVGGTDPNPPPWTPRERVARYARQGAYEASKNEGDSVVRATAHHLGVPLTIANPGVVIGHSETGETSQRIGLAATVLQLMAGRLPALVGDNRTFVPVVTIDYLAKMLSLLPTVAETESGSYWLLDDTTPPLPALLRHVARSQNVRPPWVRLPARLVQALPPRLTGANAEMLTFLSEDRYPTRTAEVLMSTQGFTHPDIHLALARWASYLRAHA